MIILHEPHANVRRRGCISALKILSAARSIIDLIYLTWSTSFDISLFEPFISVRPASLSLLMLTHFVVLFLHGWTGACAIPSGCNRRRGSRPNQDFPFGTRNHQVCPPFLQVIFLADSCARTAIVQMATRYRIASYLSKMLDELSSIAEASWTQSQALIATSTLGLDLPIV